MGATKLASFHHSHHLHHIFNVASLFSRPLHGVAERSWHLRRLFRRSTSIEATTLSGLDAPVMILLLSFSSLMRLDRSLVVI